MWLDARVNPRVPSRKGLLCSPGWCGAVGVGNRLGAGVLEVRWNVELEEVAQTESRLRQLESAASTLNVQQKQRLKELGEELPRLWESPAASVELKKHILRTVLQEV